MNVIYRIVKEISACKQALKLLPPPGIRKNYTIFWI